MEPRADAEAAGAEAARAGAARAEAMRAAGSVHAGFEPVRRAFASLLARRPGYGAALCVYADGVPVVDLWGGAYRRDSLQVVFSASKGAVAACALLLAQRGLLDLDAPVASVWPEFAQGGKERLRIRWLLTHQAGLPTVDRPLELRDVLDPATILPALERQTPYWTPGTQHGYHGVTMGTLVGEVVRRVTGRTLGRFFAAEVAAPLGLEFWIGLPEELEPRVAPLRFTAASGTRQPPAAERAMRDPQSVACRVRANPMLDHHAFNTRELHAAELPAANGIGSAHALARMYAGCIAPVDGVRLLDDATVEEACRPHAEGRDLVSCEDNRFGLGFYLPWSRLPFAGPTSFGHDGAGGALAFADRASGMAFAFLSDRVPTQLGGDPEAQPLVEAALACLARRTVRTG